MSKLPTAEFNEGWEEGRHSVDVEVMQLRAEIERLRAALLELVRVASDEANERKSCSGDLGARLYDARRALEGK